ncbi:MAG TPA: 1-deoxy-D-xylulose-5-phosphate reductoisomerase [Candidatus Gastranaerophilales bacterium]|nr:1-deoxy-D-xylulose-5-phosphate reductoisomerase [Candidatus Gastranaerophilales bacterium]
MKRAISILGSTGSIGKQALEVVEKLHGRFNVFGLAAGKNIELLKKQIIKFNPQVVSVESEIDACKLYKDIKHVEILWGKEGLRQIAENTKNDIVLIAVTGLNGLEPTISAIKNGINVALANKETLVSAGNIVTKLAKEKNVKIIPVDSEHSAIYQCINSRESSKIKRIILTASGGPFRTSTLEEIHNATVKNTLAHPKWSMGDKITVDSATLMNKGLEVIEAYWLFNVDYSNIEVIIHPQSVMHGAVEFLDGSVISQMGLPSMHIPIQYALSFPETFEGIKTGSLDFTQITGLEFEKPDFERFPCLKLAYEAGIKGGTYPAALNAINEEAVFAFLKGEIRLTDIAKIVSKGLEQHNNIVNPSYEEILDADKEARHFVLDYCSILQS